MFPYTHQIQHKASQISEEINRLGSFKLTCISSVGLNILLQKRQFVFLVMIRRVINNQNKEPVDFHPQLKQYIVNKKGNLRILGPVISQILY